MLRITKAWTNRDRPYGKAAGYGYAFWLSGLEPSGKTWWVIVGIGGRDIGLTGVTISEARDEAEIEHEIASNADDNDPGSWSVIEPSEAIAAVSAEMDRARSAIWSREYADHFALISAEYELLSRAITGGDSVRKYERFTDPA
ncbi:MAG: hypothetical protein M3P38_06920 [Chloroflexota bacterium]|nr:hypothetical protein [Chloroflexota bacterium]